MTEAKLIKLKEMFGCLEHLRMIGKHMNDPERQHFDVAIVVRDYDNIYDEMLLKGFPDFEQAFKEFAGAYYLALKKEFDEA